MIVAHKFLNNWRQFYRLESRAKNKRDLFQLTAFLINIPGEANRFKAWTSRKLCKKSSRLINHVNFEYSSPCVSGIKK